MAVYRAIILAAAICLTGAAAAEDASAEDARVVPLTELGLAPKKYEGKPIEVRNLVCYYADVGDYRCVSPQFGNPVVVFTAELTGDRERVEQNCDKAHKAFRSPRCRVNLRFSFDAEGVEDDLISGNVIRHIIRPASAEVVAAPQPRRR